MSRRGGYGLVVDYVLSRVRYHAVDRDLGCIGQLLLRRLLSRATREGGTCLGHETSGLTQDRAYVLLNGLLHGLSGLCMLYGLLNSLDLLNHLLGGLLYGLLHNFLSRLLDGLLNRGSSRHLLDRLDLLHGFLHHLGVLNDLLDHLLLSLLYSLDSLLMSLCNDLSN